MSEANIYVSVIIATYNSGAGIQRVFDSLGAQTLPRENFEVIFIDDGSTDDTYQTVQNYASTHKNVKFARIENSGWPSKPRNVGVAMADGEYLMFMDHDDSLYPHALEAAAAYGIANQSDIVVPKEMKSNDPWWYLEALVDGNIPQVPKDSGFFRMLPMVPHKLYKRRMYVDNQISFPERRRALWEDQYINVAAFRHAKVVSVLADTPFYLWHASDTNTSHTFDPKNEDFWHRLNDIMEFMHEQFAASELKGAHTAALALQVQVRVIDRLTRLLTTAPAKTKEMAFGHARNLLAKYLDDAIYDALPWRHKVLTHLLRAGRPDLMVEFQSFDLNFRYTNTLDAIHWDEDGLHGSLRCTFSPAPGFVGIRQVEGEIIWNLPPEIVSEIPRELINFNDTLKVGLNVALKNRTSKISWFPTVTDLRYTMATDQSGSVALTTTGDFVIKQEHLDNSAGEGPSVWDLESRSTYSGMIRSRPPVYRGKAFGAVFGDAAITGYANNKHKLSIDADQALRSVVIDNLRTEARGHIEHFSITLDGVPAFGESRVDASLFLISTAQEVGQTPDALQDPEKFITTGIKITGGREGLIAEGSFSVSPGEYSLYAFRSGKYVKTSKSMIVKTTGHFIILPNTAIRERAEQLFV